jgi:hypothetical protein
LKEDEIIEMARQAGMGYDEEQNVYIANIDDLQDFAKLVAAKEREACAMLCLWHNNTMSQNPTLFHMAELIRARGEA